MKTLSLISGTNNLKVNGIVLEFNNSKELNKSIRKHQAQGFDFNKEFLRNTDEFDGLCQANQNGFNPYECTIMC